MAFTQEQLDKYYGAITKVLIEIGSIDDGINMLCLIIAAGIVDSKNTDLLKNGVFKRIEEYMTVFENDKKEEKFEKI